VPIEERDPAEVLGTAAARVPVRNPAFDVTPAELVTGIITHYYHHPRKHYHRYDHRRHRGHRDGAYLLGGIVIGSILTHALTAPPAYAAPPRAVRYETARYETARYETRVVARRLFRDIHGNCFERRLDSAGGELLIELPADECAW
jgi:hypothetical protein